MANETSRTASAPARTVLALTLGLATAAAAQQTGPAEASVTAGHYNIGNAMLSASWTIDQNHLKSLTITDTLHHRTVQLSDPFAVLLADGSIDNADSLETIGEPVRKSLPAEASASRLSERFSGVEFDTPLVSKGAAFHATWAVILRDDSNYIRQSLTISAGDKDLPVHRVQLLDIALSKAQVVGSVKGSPIVSGDLFLGFEHPLSGSNVARGRATAFIDRELPLKAGQSVTYSSVIGVAREGQMRRDFLTYVERERAHPYRTFLHYNSWYDLGYFSPYDEAGALDRVNAFGRELHEKRGVTLDSYLFDDGWDNHATLWSFNNGFPSGFSNVRREAEKYGTDPGVWMSPWGGYADPKKERVEFGRQQGFEVVSNGFALSGPKYYERFRDVCLEMIRKYGINQFKFDGTGNANSVFQGSAFDSDFSAALHLIGELRQEKPDLYINLTTGTYPSPFWLLFADSIWLGGEDDAFAGVGPYRERWITYRDADTYDRVVKAGPLYPLNSLMLHGMIYASLHKQLNEDPSNDFRNEVRSYFGTGTQLQEMYLTPSLLSTQNWDDLAEAAKWSRGNASVLKDTHWVGGDPAWLEVYGWAAWAPQKATLVLRNPSDKAQTIRLDPQLIFELPQGAAKRFTAHSPWKEDAAKATLSLEAGTQHEFLLAPFEVLTFDLTPQ